MTRILCVLIAGLFASSLSLADDRAASSERSVERETTEESGVDYMERMYDEGIFTDPAEPGGIQEAVKICVDGSGWCLETTSYIDCNDWLSSYGEEGVPSGISCYDVC
jgi:hypothetical protein